MFGAIEGGGTKFKCAVGVDNQIYDEILFPTTDPIDTINQVVAFFLKYDIKSLGIGSFGPIIIDKNDKNYGMITSTPKQNWQNFNLYHALKSKLSCEIEIVTDVQASCIGEYTYGFKEMIQNIIYITVGTGIGVGVIYQGKLINGLHHPEMGHIMINRYNGDDFKSVCPYHENCLEGLASGHAIAKRYPHHPNLSEVNQLWDLEGYYLASGIYNYLLTFAPDKIILGGGVMNQPKLLPEIKKHLLQINNHYYNYSRFVDLDSFLVLPRLGSNSALIGGLTLAKKVYLCTQK